MKAEFNRVLVEATGRIGLVAYVARVYRKDPRRLEWAYGRSASMACDFLKADPQVIDLEDLELVLGEGKVGDGK